MAQYFIAKYYAVSICLAVSPSLKACGIPGRARLFEVVQKVREVNAQRRRFMLGRCFTGKSSNAPELKSNPALELDYIVAMPRMARYMEISSQIYGIYLKYVAPEHIHVYSIDEVFIDATQYLKLYKLTAREFTMKLIQDVLKVTGITATAGIGTNLYLCKIAMDITAKHIPADKDGVLKACYHNSLSLANEAHCRSIAFPRISTGVYGYPPREATQIAVKTVCQWRQPLLEEAIFCCFSDTALAIYREILLKIKAL